MNAVSAVGAPLQCSIARLRQSPPGAPARHFAKGDSREHNTFFCSPFTTTTASDRRRSDQDQLQADATRRVRAAGERALVLGGGGSAGNAWLIGVIAGLFDAGLDVTEADLVIGTSAASTAACQLTSASPTQLLADILSAAPRQRTGPV
jgi:hypothetical protein